MCKQRGWRTLFFFAISLLRNGPHIWVIFTQMLFPNLNIAQSLITLPGILEVLTSRDVYLHFFCLDRQMLAHLAHLKIATPVMFLSCSTTAIDVMKLLDVNARRGIESVVISPRTVLEESHTKLSKLVWHDVALVTWIVLKNDEQRCREFFNTRYGLSIVAISKNDGSFNVLDMNERAWHRLYRESKKVRNFSAVTNHKIIIGCAQSSEKVTLRNICLTMNTSILAQALSVVNSNFSIVSVPSNSWEDSVRRNEAHVHGIGSTITEERFQMLHITAFTTGTDVYYVQKKTRPVFDYLKFLPQWLSFFSLSMAACVVVLTLTDVVTETRLSPGGIQNKIMALIASTLLLASSLTTERTAARFVLAGWFFACFSQAVFLHSFLIASVTYGFGWEADNTLERLYPKLISGHLVPCCLPMYFFDEMFKKAGRGDKHNSVLDVMAAAAQRFDTMATNIITRDSLEGCMEKAARGTHVFVEFGKMHCWYNLVSWYWQGYIVEGQETLLVFPVGFAMRKDYYLRRDIDLIARRLFETGWHDALDRQFFRKCLTTENVRKESILPDNRQLLIVLGGGCSLSLFFLCSELLLNCAAKLYRGHMPASIFTLRFVDVNCA